MGKVNLRNRLRENLENEGEPNLSENLTQNEKPLSSVPSVDSQNNTNLRSQLRTNAMETSNKTSQVEEYSEQEEVEEITENSRTNLRNRIRVNPEPEIENIKIEKKQEEIITPKIVNTPSVEPEVPQAKIRMRESSESIFKDDKKDIDRSILKDNKSKGNNALDKLNVNKKMLYIALVFALFSGILIINYLNSFRAEKLYNSELIPVVVINKDIKEKSSITLKDLDKVNIPKKYVLKNAIIIDSKFDSKTLDGKLALTNLYQNEQLLTTRVADPEDSPWLSPIVPDGNRAFTIVTKGLSYVKPTDHVDIFVSIQNPRDNSKVINTPILQNALVLAIDGKFKIDNDEPFSGDSVTIAVPNELLSVFSILQENGSFKVALRREGDTGTLKMKYSPFDIEKMFTDVAEKPVVKHVVVKPVVVNTPPVVRHVVQRPVVYTPPRQVVKPRPVVRHVVQKPKPVVKPKPVIVQPKPVVVPQQTTVTVINGTKVNQHKVNQ